MDKTMREETIETPPASTPDEDGPISDQNDEGAEF